ncbi:MAG: peptidoglycan-binding protein, partial [Patescibacteria group bacterium]
MSTPVKIGMESRVIESRVFNIRVDQLTDTSAHVRWETNIPMRSSVEYKIGTISRPDGFATAVTSNFVTTHDTLLTYLLPNTTYYYYIRLWDSAQNEIRTETISFKTALSLTSSGVETKTNTIGVAKPAPQAELCYTCPQPPVVQLNTVEQIQQQSQAGTKETTRELQGRIQELVLKLQDQIKALQDQIVELNTKVQSQGQELVAVKLELQFTKTIGRGASGEDVKKLQEFLRSSSDVYPEGVVNGYFGPLTEIAVKRFQEKNGLEPVGVVGPKTRVALNAQSSTNGNCTNSTARPCFDRVTPGKAVMLATKAGENSLKACLNSKSSSLRGFAHTKTTFSELESYQYCFEGKSTVQIRFFAGSVGSPIVLSPKSKSPKLSCTQAPEFSILGWLDPDAPWSISEPSRIIGDPGYSYIYFYGIETMLKTKSGTLFAAGYGINTDAGWSAAV